MLQLITVGLGSAVCGLGAESSCLLPLTGPYLGCRLHSCFHNTTAMVGAGVLGLPYAFKYLTWPGGIVVLVCGSAAEEPLRCVTSAC